MTDQGRLSPHEQQWVESLVVEYVTKTKQWKQDEYRIEHRGITEDEKRVIVIVVNLEDEVNPIPGAGKSVELQIDRKERTVIKELGFQ